MWYSTSGISPQVPVHFNLPFLQRRFCTLCMQNRKQITEQNNVFLTESEVLQRLQKSSVYYCRYQALNDDWKKTFRTFKQSTESSGKST